MMRVRKAFELSKEDALKVRKMCKATHTYLSLELTRALAACTNDAGTVTIEIESTEEMDN